MSVRSLKYRFEQRSKVTPLFMEDYLQDRLIRETSEQGFSDLPFRFAEISKVLLDVCVFHLSFGSTQHSFPNVSEPLMTSKTPISFAHCSKTCVKPGRPKVEMVSKHSTTANSVYAFLCALHLLRGILRL